jgi:uncharacterized protein (TIGR00255 family)
MLGDTAPEPQGHASRRAESAAHRAGAIQCQPRREGDKLKAVILDRVAGIAQPCRTHPPAHPEIVAAYREKLGKRLEELLPADKNTLDPDRLNQEVILFAQKIDVDEELDRLLTHLDEVTRASTPAAPPESGSTS